MTSTNPGLSIRLERLSFEESAEMYQLYLPVGSSKNSALATLTQPSSSPPIWELEMHNGTDSRLTVAFINECLLKALDVVEEEWRNLSDGLNKEGAYSEGALVIVGRKDQSKFFSNGKLLLAAYGVKRPTN